MSTTNTIKFTSTNTNVFRKQMVEHVLSFYSDYASKEERVSALEADARACYSKMHFGFNPWNAGTEMGQAGCFLCYTDQIEAFMKQDLGMTKDKYKNEDKNIEARWELYKNLCGKAVRDAIENTNKLFDKAEIENM